MDRGARWAAVRGVTERRATENKKRKVKIKRYIHNHGVSVGSMGTQ